MAVSWSLGTNLGPPPIRSTITGPYILFRYSRRKHDQGWRNTYLAACLPFKTLLPLEFSRKTSCLKWDSKAIFPPRPVVPCKALQNHALTTRACDFKDPLSFSSRYTVSFRKTEKHLQARIHSAAVDAQPPESDAQYLDELLIFIRLPESFGPICRPIFQERCQ